MKKIKKKMIILGIETSCDETSAAVVEIKKSSKFQVLSFKVLSNIIFSQISIHKKYGGVVPEVAARNHVKNIIPVIDLALKKARVAPMDIDRIAVTYGPGLITSLMVGVEAARNLAYAWNKPIIPVDHIKGHAYAALLSSNTHNSPHSPLTLRGEVDQVPPLKVRARLPARQGGQPAYQRGREELLPMFMKFPILVLVVSGGHTELLLMKDEKSFKKIGQTIDDAAGEAFDKVAKMLGLGFPGGPAISKLAEKGNPQAFDFPRPMMHTKDFNFSFSGLKTAVLYTVLGKINPPNPPLRKWGQEGGWPQKSRADIAASFQEAVVDVLVAKTIRAAQKYKAKTIILGGGVAANKLLRKTMKTESDKLDIPFIVPEIELCTDNAAPIAVAGFFGKPVLWQKINANPQLEIK